ncbi:olfactory receptor 13H1-like [Python bivittatus]|uniref:Olfactory receptor n=1 Tax=Python bivittatus TaxID=176946 RepID=A0A9F2R7X7_PYTBI|nr:olfactory receptor 13H1-like [Python bivittatus]
MEKANKTALTEFILIGFSGRPKSRLGLMVFMVIVYSVTVVGNGLIILVITMDYHLHKPMYFFLSNLSFLDISYSTSSVPQVIANLLVDKPTMTFSMCYLQMSSGVWLGITEGFVLAVMAYDRYIAISAPLHYMIIMSKKLCIQLAVGTWVAGLVLGVIPIYVMPAHFCGDNVIDHFACELKAIFKLICSDTSLNQVTMFTTGVLTFLGPFAFILFSYLQIVAAILRVHSAGGRLKAFSTCVSHLMVVTIFYSTAIFSYLRPQTKSVQEMDKIVSLFYGVLTPMLNPLIYTLRNKEVIRALKNLTGQKL